ncbi:PilZ domain-containing protein [Methylocystis sp. MJC1]|jgi:hypothetical protein|uniref:PilZ domain-containing protein n=1 Tax=Methylocystis sp. MJC1 TaxID=2654282 RepID=UPI0013EDCB2D|nr:PilZ domain-containing protein [Methylocystis sp. MJC1]KAF2989632.1 hypothetical protein MJC1_03184 [Methylocystis sp. MJC1]MBU6525660.1 PilZ domain-containing protein [Methylocystis sp. MJC1]UZX12133.1 PilZ domain-containing protein [Methylocystis sp. MJC1]
MGINFQPKTSHFETEPQPRLQINFEGRYTLLESNEEYPCQTCEISPYSARLFAPVAALPGEKVALCLNELGRFAGIVLGPTQNGFDMCFHLMPKKRERLARQLAWYADRSTGYEESRRHDRIFIPFMDLTVLRLARGDEQIVRIKSLSHSDVVLETDRVIPIGAEVAVGNTPAKVVRILDDGVACEFARHFRPGEIDETTRL